MVAAESYAVLRPDSDGVSCRKIAGPNAVASSSKVSAEPSISAGLKRKLEVARAETKPSSSKGKQQDAQRDASSSEDEGESRSRSVVKKQKVVDPFAKKGKKQAASKTVIQQPAKRKNEPGDDSDSDYEPFRPATRPAAASAASPPAKAPVKPVAISSEDAKRAKRLAKKQKRKEKRQMAKT